MTTIKASEYSPNSPATPSSPLTKGQVTLLNKGAANDISQRVKTIVQNHLGYQGNANFRTTFTKKEVTFTLKDGPATENRTLKLVNGHWMLSHNNTTPAALDPTLEAEVNTLITHILTNIGKASHTNVPDPVHTNPAVAVDAIDGKVSSADDSEVEQIKIRLAFLENQLRSNLTLEQSLKVQQQILDELIGLRSALEKQSHGTKAEKKELRRFIEGLQKTLEKSDNALQKSEAELRKKQTELESERQNFQRAWEAKHQQAFELNQKINALEKEVSEKGTALKKVGAELESLIQKIADESKKIKQTAQKSAEEFKNNQSKWLVEMYSLEKELQSVQSELDKTQQQLKTEKDERQRQVAGLQKTIEENKIALQNSEANLKSKQAELEAEQKKLQQALTEKNQGALKSQQEIAHLQNAVAQKEEELKKAIEGLNEQKSKLQDAKAAYESQLNDTTQHLNTGKDQLKKQVEDLKKTIEENKAAAQKSQDEFKSKQIAFDEQQSKLLANKTNLEKQLESLKKELRTKEDELEKFKSFVEAELERLQVGFNAEKKKFQESEKALQDQYNKMKSQFEIEATLTNFLLKESIPALQKELKEKDQQLKAAAEKAKKVTFQTLKNEPRSVKATLQHKVEDKEPVRAEEREHFKASAVDVLSKFQLLTKDLLLAQKDAELENREKELYAQAKDTAKTKSELEQANQMQETLQVQNKSLASQLKVAETTVEVAEHAIEDLQQSLQEKEDALKQLENDATLTEQRVNYYKDNAKKLNQENEYLKLVIENTEQDKKLETARSDLNRTQQTAKRRELYSKYLEARLKRLEGTDEIGILSQENSNLRDKSSSAEHTIEAKTKEIASLSEQLAQAKQTQATLESTIEDLQSKLSQVTDEAKTASQEATKKESKLLEELKEYEEIFTETKTELTQSKENNIKLTDQLKTASELNTLALQQIQDLEKSLKEKDLQLVSATQMQASLQQKAEAYKSARDDAELLAKEALEASQIAKYNESQINEDFNLYQEEMEAFVEEQNTQLTAKQSENEDLKNQLETEKLFKDFALELNQSLQKSVDEQDHELKVAAENVIQIKLTLDQATEKQEALQVQNSDLNSKLELAEKAGENSTLTIKELRESLRKNELELENTRLDVELAQIDTEEAKVDAKNALKEVNDALLEAKLKIKSLEGELSQAQRELRHLEAEMNSEPLSDEDILNMLKKRNEENHS